MAFAYSPTATRQTGLHVVPLASSVRILEWMVLLAALAFAAGRVLPRAWRHLNTDFPNYYVTARLLREGYSTAHMYEWIWLQRQKDRMGILSSDQPVVGFVPHTPFSALMVYPLTRWPPLLAKRIWIIANLMLVVVVAGLLRSLTGLEWRHIALLTALNYPLLRNFEYGQYYVVILALLTMALWLYVRQRRFAAGLLVGVAAGLKIFPVFFAFYFARKHDLRGVLGLAVGALAAALASVTAFGLEVHRVYFMQVLPWALRGEAMNPYAMSPNSLSALLHKLFIFEPQWNPHPAVFAPALYAVLHAFAQIVVFAPAILLAVPRNYSPVRLQQEWSLVLLALLGISTLPASYHFTLLILPVTIFAAAFLRERKYKELFLLVLLYLGIGFPAWPTALSDGWWALAAVPRLYLVLLLCCLAGFTLWESSELADLRPSCRTWVAVFALLIAAQIGNTLHHQHGIYDRYRCRIAMPAAVLSAVQPAVDGSEVAFIAMKNDGYRLAQIDRAGVHVHGSAVDGLSDTAANGAVWTERVGTQSAVWEHVKDGPENLVIKDAESPVVSPDGRWLAYLRTDRAKGTLWLHSLFNLSPADMALTSAEYDVNEMTFLADGSLIFSAALNGHPSALYRISRNRAIGVVQLSEARYLAASADGHWLAYSRLDHGVWNLWLRNLRNGATQRLTEADCNDTFPAWEADSKALIYSSDCGRALWFAALNRIQIQP
jgi:hypothetical protein